MSQALSENADALRECLQGHEGPDVVLSPGSQSVARRTDAAPPKPFLRPTPEFLAPLPLLAVGLMAVNDAYLKPVLHDTLTGKLSDLAGCFFLPLWISALLALGTGWTLQRRLAIGCASTAMLFTAISTSRLAAGAVCAALEVATSPFGLSGHRIASDPTDLLALPLVGAAWWYGQRAGVARGTT